MHEFVNVSQNLRHRAVEVRRNLLSHFHRLIQRARQRRIFDDRDLVLDGPLTDAQRQVILALGDYQRRGHALHLVTDGNCVVSGIDHHGGCLGQVLHHVAPQPLALQTANPRLHLRVAFDILGFFLDVVLAHAQVLLVAPHLAKQVDASEYQEHSGSLPEKLHQRSAEKSPTDGYAFQRQRQKGVQLVAGDDINRPQKERQQNKGLHQHGQILAGQLLELRKRTEARHIGSQLLQADAEAGGDQPKRERRQRHRQAAQSQGEKVLPG